jgi:hypothetical protein
MRRWALAIGLLLMIAGIFILNQGVQIITPFAGFLGLVSHVQTERLVIPQTLLTVPASSNVFLPADLRGGVQVKGSLVVGVGQEVGFYVMDEGNFSLWRAGKPSIILLAKPSAVSYNFTITPQATGTYYFVFDNQDTARRVVIFSLSVVEDTTVLSPLVEYAGYLVFALGIVMFAIGARTGKPRPKPEVAPAVTPAVPLATRVHCRFCGAEIARDQMFCEKCGRAQR